MAERLGFEPRKELPLCRFSRPVLSTAQPSLRKQGFISIILIFNKKTGDIFLKYLEQLDYEDLNELIKLLEIDDNNLYNFYNGLDTNIEFEDNKINNLFKNFQYK